MQAAFAAQAAGVVSNKTFSERGFSSRRPRLTLLVIQNPNKCCTAKAIPQASVALCARNQQTSSTSLDGGFVMWRAPEVE